MKARLQWQVQQELSPDSIPCLNWHLPIRNTKFLESDLDLQGLIDLIVKGDTAIM